MTTHEGPLGRTVYGHTPEYVQTFDDAPKVDGNAPSIAAWNEQRQALADYLNARLRSLRTWGDLKAMLAAADSDNSDVRLVSLRGTKYSGRRALFGFTGGRVEFNTTSGWGHYTDDPDQDSTAYLYDDAVNSGKCKVRNLYRVARWEVR